MGDEGGRTALGRAAGGRFCLQDNCQTPDTLMTLFEYPGFTVRYSVRQGNSRRMEARPNGIAFYGPTVR